VSTKKAVPTCGISVGRHATLDEPYNDWELTTEMVHFSFPSVKTHVVEVARLVTAARFDVSKAVYYR
jgi:hypothetical protein